MWEYRLLTPTSCLLAIFPYNQFHYKKYTSYYKERSKKKILSQKSYTPFHFKRNFPVTIANHLLAEQIDCYPSNILTCAKINTSRDKNFDAKLLVHVLPCEAAPWQNIWRIVKFNFTLGTNRTKTCSFKTHAIITLCCLLLAYPM